MCDVVTDHYIILKDFFKTHIKKMHEHVLFNVLKTKKNQAKYFLNYYYLLPGSSHV